MTSAPVYSPEAVAAEVIRQGGSVEQAWVAAALVTGVESNGTLDDQNPTSTACGLFQFLDTTWASNGGTQYSPSACGATFSQQVSVFLTASSGNNFYPWEPDLDPSRQYDGKPIYAPVAGSPVADAIANLAAGGTMTFLGNVPTDWADAGGAEPASPTPIPLGNGGVNVGGGVLSGLSGLEKGVDAVLTDLTSSTFWQRLGLGVAGVVLVIGGIILFVSTTKTGQKVESDAAIAAVA